MSENLIIHHCPLLKFISKKAENHIIFMLFCDGEKLLPTWFENGVNTMFPIEIGVWGDRFEPARKKYGKEMPKPHFVRKSSG